MTKTAERSAARLAAVQALYQMDVAGKGVIDALAEFEAFWIGQDVDEVSFKPAENAFFRDILAGVVREQRAIDGRVEAALVAGWPLKRIEALMRAVLRAGVYELDRRRDIPARVIVSEYVDVANAFVDKDETGMINAVLDELGRKLRADELDPTRGPAA